MIEIDDLADVPHHLDTVAERIWTAWWRDKGHGIERITVPLRESLERRAIPFTLVAHRDGGFCGTVSVITSDVSERPDLTPWIAALWIEPDLRRRGLGAGAPAPRGAPPRRPRHRAALSLCERRTARLL